MNPIIDSTPSVRQRLVDLLTSIRLRWRRWELVIVIAEHKPVLGA